MANELAKIVDDTQLVQFAKMDDFLKVVNSAPPTSFIRNHPLAAGVKYLPIDKVELMLTKMFQQWRVEILREGQMLNSIYTTVRLHYKHPITGEWTFQDGAGASPIQTDKGESAANMAAIKNDAIMKALPAAESFALKDAAEKIGRVFGKDLNRQNVVDFTPSYGTDEIKAELDEDTYQNALSEVKIAKTSDEFKNILSGLTPEQKQLITPLINERIKELKDAKSS